MHSLLLLDSDGLSHSACICKTFVSKKGDVFENWKDFKAGNKYTGYEIVAPKNGVFTSSGVFVDAEVIRMKRNPRVLTPIADLKHLISLQFRPANIIKFEIKDEPFHVPLLPQGLANSLLKLFFGNKNAQLSLQERLQISGSFFLFNHTVYNCSMMQKFGRSIDNFTLDEFGTLWREEADRFRKFNKNVPKEVVRDLVGNAFHQLFIKNSPSAEDLLKDPEFQKRYIDEHTLTRCKVSHPLILKFVLLHIETKVPQEDVSKLVELAKLMYLQVNANAFFMPAYFEDVLYDVFDVLEKKANKFGVAVERLYKNFDGTFISVPDTLKGHFYSALQFAHGNVKCSTCSGSRFV